MKDRVFRDPVHGLIEFRGADRGISTLLETRAFQRLRRIKQMGFAWLVYPGAEHSRFGHALGAFHIAGRVTAQLALDERVALHIKVAALLHDIGHGPFSHSWERVFDGCDHETWGTRLVTEDSELRDTLCALDPELPEVLTRFANKTYVPKFAHKLVSSQLDVDRLDYLLRDGHYSGAGYATYDLDWIIHALRIDAVHAADDANDLVVDYRRGMFAVEQYLFARSYMYAQVYHHKAVRAAEWMFVDVMRRFSMLAQNGLAPPHFEIGAKLANGDSLSTADYMTLDDLSVTLAIDQWAKDKSSGGANDDVLRDLSHRFTRRQLFKTIELGDDPNVTEDLRDRVHAVAQEHFGDAADYYYHLDTAKQVGYVSGDDQELYVVDHPRRGTVTLGQLLNELPLGRPSATVRLLCAPELLSKLIPLAEQALARAGVSEALKRA